jgi:hypothetical protein
LGLLFWTFAFDLGLFAFGFLMGKAFWMWEAFGREDCWKEIAEGGKWIAEGKLLKGGLLMGELLKENC